MRRTRLAIAISPPADFARTPRRLSPTAFSSAAPPPDLQAMAIIFETADPTGAAPARLANAVLTEVWSPPLADPSSIAILRI